MRLLNWRNLVILAEDSGSLSGEDPVPTPLNRRNREPMHLTKLPTKTWMKEIEMATQYMPSSMGITFIVNGNANIVRGCLSFATYRNAKVPIA